MSVRFTPAPVRSAGECRNVDLVCVEGHHIVDLVVVAKLHIGDQSVGDVDGADLRVDSVGLPVDSVAMPVIELPGCSQPKIE